MNNGTDLLFDNRLGRCDGINNGSLCLRRKVRVSGKLLIDGLTDQRRDIEVIDFSGDEVGIEGGAINGEYRPENKQ